MKKREFKDLKVKEEKELIKLVTEKRTELFKTIPNLAVKQEKNLKKAKNLRKEIAQIKTFLREKEIVSEETK